MQTMEILDETCHHRDNLKTKVFGRHNASAGSTYQELIRKWFWKAYPHPLPPPNEIKVSKIATSMSLC